MATGSTKRTLTARNVWRVTGGLVTSLPVLVVSLVRPRVPGALREKVVLAVTAVNECRLCAWGHTRWALAEGVPLEEINQILAGDDEALRAADPAEAAAILFAQSYAERIDRIDPEALASLRRHFSRAQVAEIVASVRAITFGNLLGNTVDTALARLRGHGRASGSEEHR
jgi:AhpD family alkylhydroperoxidase